jgi:hypothetical protein
VIVSILTFGLVAVVTFIFLTVIFQVWRRFPRRSADDLIPFLQSINVDEVAQLFDPGEEAHLRSECSEKDFRVLQRKRLYLADEYLQRMAHNAAVLAEWANTELQREHPLTQELASELHQRALNVRVYAFFTRFKLNLWLILRLESARLLPATHVADFRECAGIQGLHAYDSLKNAAGSLFLHFGHTGFEHLMQNL